jgi:D-arginine dehydrogenase
MPTPEYDVIVVGAGIAGASVAYFLAQLGAQRVLVLEREEQIAVHASGRSASVLAELHRNPLVRRLIREGAGFLREPPPGFTETPLVEPVGVLVPALGRAILEELVELGAASAQDGIDHRMLGPDEVLRRVPVLEPSGLVGGLLLPGGGHIDVHALLSGYLRGLARAGGELRLRTEVLDLLREGPRCVGVATSAGEIRGRAVVNAAGAWAGLVSGLAGAAPIALEPRRRTIITFAAPADSDPRRWPMVELESERLYFKYESGGLLASPMDATPSPPCDARPTEEDAALAADRLARLAPRLAPRSIRHRWAGLRTFAPDEIPLVGWDPLLEGFFWLAGQGGFGIETSPALGKGAAELLLGKPCTCPEVEALSPARFTHR